MFFSLCYKRTKWFWKQELSPLVAGPWPWAWGGHRHDGQWQADPRKAQGLLCPNTMPTIIKCIYMFFFLKKGLHILFFKKNLKKVKNNEIVFLSYMSAWCTTVICQKRSLSFSYQFRATKETRSQIVISDLLPSVPGSSEPVLDWLNNTNWSLVLTRFNIK